MGDFRVQEPPEMDYAILCMPVYISPQILLGFIMGQDS